MTRRERDFPRRAPLREDDPNLRRPRAVVWVIAAADIFLPDPAGTSQSRPWPWGADRRRASLWRS